MITLAMRIVATLMMLVAIRWAWIFEMTEYRSHLRHIMLPIAFATGICAIVLWLVSFRIKFVSKSDRAD
jgi:hypothetical protein